jgi:hypothetical protein
MYREPDFSRPRLAAAPECRFEPAPADTVLPDGFMSTTNHPTYVKIGGRWRMPERPRMDSHLGKLKDRGTHQAFGVVTNAQDFMRSSSSSCRRGSGERAQARNVLIVPTTHSSSPAPTVAS